MNCSKNTESNCHCPKCLDEHAEQSVTPDPKYSDHPLYEVFVRAIDQAMYGKGERHGGCVTPFTEQRWARISAGPAGVGGLAFQVIKKFEEALEKPDLDSFEREFLGSLVYMGMVYLKKMGKV